MADWRTGEPVAESNHHLEFRGDHLDRAMQSFGGYKRLVGIESASKPIQRHVVEAAGACSASRPCYSIVIIVDW